ncbi:MAG: HDOD domain-containing protein [Pseudomonadota bacterium]
MSDCAAPHKGIELDYIDLSGLNETKDAVQKLPMKITKVDSKTFLKNIFKKMNENNSFLSFYAQVQNVNKILGMKYSSANDIATEILKDVALTTKLLKLVNSAFYGHFTSKGVATISEAMIILGTEEIKLAAANLKIYEFIKDIANIKILKDKSIKSLQRSIIARHIAIEEGLKDAEAIQISAMLYDFGQYLVALFSPDLFINIEIMVDEKSITREEASKSIIGITYSELGRFVGSKLHLPASIIYAMKPATDLHIDKNRLSMADLQRNICAFTNDLCNMEYLKEGTYTGSDILRISDRYRKSLEIPPTQVIELLKISKKKIKTYTDILNSES